ncbi:MAG: hypothetical protein M1830_009184 [Pleopsidium flavum]|nr:MAG: hypothetical protein M1830_009206 [Pleopsidium flavum]KAI9874880.1 MAG: hypothetical protein M1830_009184 [Pleopsidium flavum]
MHFTAFFLLSSLLLCCATAIQQRSLPQLGPSNSTYAVNRLPNITYPLPASWAGEILIPGTQDELFFWLFAAESSTSSNNLIIWLNGGPGCSSLEGLTSENGPLSFVGNATAPVANPYSWTKLANVLYLDQPVGAGYSAGPNQATDNADVVEDFYNWLKAFYAVFPGLKSKNTYLMGESYAGVYIPYFASKILSDKSLNISLKALAIGDGTLGNYAAMFDVPSSTYIRQHQNLLGVPKDIVDVFNEADQRCGFRQVLDQLTYPPKGPISIPGDPEGENFRLDKRQVSTASDCDVNLTSPSTVNQSIYAACFGGCATYSTAAAYLTLNRPCFSVYNTAYNCQNTPTDTAFVNYLNLPSVRTAIHAANKTWASCNNTILDALSTELVTPPAYSILPYLLNRGLCVHVYSGDQDFLLNHIGTELIIQNMTWNGKQGFQHPPNNSFLVDGKYAGNWGRERGLSYHHILRAGHAVPHDQPAAAFAFVRDFVLGNAG